MADRIVHDRLDLVIRHPRPAYTTNTEQPEVIHTFDRVTGMNSLIAITLLFAAWAASVLAQCPPRSDPCMNDQNFARCKKIEKCKSFQILESCPYQFTCADHSPALRPSTPRPPTRPAPTPTRPAPTPTRPRPTPTRPRPTPTGSAAQTPVRLPVAPLDPCPPANDECMTAALYKECQEIAKKGCTNIIALMSCPIAGFGCLDPLP